MGCLSEVFPKLGPIWDLQKYDSESGKTNNKWPLVIHFAKMLKRGN